jgi:hypothetical protein
MDNKAYIIKLKVYEDNEFYEDMTIQMVFATHEDAEESLIKNGYKYVDDKLTIELKHETGITKAVADISEVQIAIKN